MIILKKGILVEYSVSYHLCILFVFELNKIAFIKLLWCGRKLLFLFMKLYDRISTFSAILHRNRNFLLLI